MINYRQCEIQRGDVHEVCWLPAMFAVLGKYLKINGVNGWKVIATYQTLPGDYVLEHSQDYRNAFPSLK